MEVSPRNNHREDFLDLFGAWTEEEAEEFAGSIDGFGARQVQVQASSSHVTFCVLRSLDVFHAIPRLFSIGVIGVVEVALWRISYLRWLRTGK